MKNKKIPKYPILRIYISAIILHVMLVFPVFAIITLKNDPNVWKKNNVPEKSNNVASKPSQFHFQINLPDNKENSNITPGERNISKSNSLTANLLFTAVIIIFIVNYPFKIYFNRKRKNKIIQPQLYKYCRKYLLKMPLIFNLRKMSLISNSPNYYLLNLRSYCQTINFYCQRIQKCS